MARKAIAAILLVVIAAWAEMALAPMLVMHAGHMRVRHEMAADMPTHAAHHMHQGSSGQSMAEQKACCPGFHKAQSADVLELVSGAPACDDPHSCCFRQGPQSVPAPVGAVRDARSKGKRLVRAMAPAALNGADPVRVVLTFANGDRAPTLRYSAQVLGMTLRV